MFIPEFLLEHCTEIHSGSKKGIALKYTQYLPFRTPIPYSVPNSNLLLIQVSVNEPQDAADEGSNVNA